MFAHAQWFVPHAVYGGCTGHISCYPYTRTYPRTYGMSGYFWLWRQSVTIKTVVSVSQGIYNTENSTDQLEIRVSKHFFRLWKKKRFIRVVNRLFRVTVSSPMSRMRCTKKTGFYVTSQYRAWRTDIHTDRQTDRQTDTSGPKITFERASLRRYTGSTRTTLVVGSIRSRLREPPSAVIRPTLTITFVAARPVNERTP